MIFLAQAAEEGTSIWDNLILDEFEIPFGAWIDQTVDWIATKLETLLDVVAWPFSFLIDNIVDRFLAEISWIWVVLGMFVIASLVRNIKVGAFVALALTICGLLGNAYWIETAKTLGFIGVAVLLCVIIGIPVGVLCGRVDSAWQIVRPMLDAMQVVHSFVYMLPFIFFFGIGEVSATMVTMVFALPPLIRLTNLGIRQVPEDVVEASRAYGATEFRVLTDVQLPLARPAIMTGLNQTLLLAISMLGIAAIMGAGGLGRLLFRALSNQDVALATSGGLAFFLVAVVLDRISQREETDAGNLFHRIRRAWAHRTDPEALIPDEDKARVVVTREVFSHAAVSARERTLMLIAGTGGLLAAISTFLTWTSDAGRFSGYGRRVDENLAGQVFSGLSASGGSWFGFIVLGLGLFVVAAVIVALVAPGRGPRWMAADGATIAAIAMLLVTLVHLLARAVPGSSAEALDPGTGIGVILAFIGSAVASIGTVMWTRIAPHAPLRPLRANIAWGRIVGVSVASVVLLIAALSGWTFDRRGDVVITPELQAEIDRLTQEAIDNPANAGPIAAELSAAMATAQRENVQVTDGFSSDGPRLGLWTLIFGVTATALALPAAGVYGRDENKLWFWCSVTAGVGVGIASIALAWILTHVRSADPNYVTGIGSFLAMTAGFFIVAATMNVLKEFRRAKVYEDDEAADAIVAEEAAMAPA